MWVVVTVFFPVQVKLTFMSTLTFQACSRLKLESDCVELIPCTKLFKAGITKGPPGRGKVVKMSILVALAM